MRKILSIFLSIFICFSILVPLSGCGNKSIHDTLKGVFFVNDGVILLVKKGKPAVEVYDRKGNVIYKKLKHVALADYPQISDYVSGNGNLYLLNFPDLMNKAEQESYRCNFAVTGYDGIIEHNYIINTSQAAYPDITDISATAENGIATLSLSIDPKYARIFNVWTEDVYDDERFAESALECTSTFDQLQEGKMIYQCGIDDNCELSFFTRGLYNINAYSDDELEKLDNTNHPDFYSQFINIDIGNPYDLRVCNLYIEGEQNRFTIYTPTDSDEIANVTYTTEPVYEPVPVVLTAQLEAKGNKAVISVDPFPNAVYYRVVVTEICDGEEKIVLNKSLNNLHMSASTNIRTDKTAKYVADVYAKLSDGKTTERIQVEGFTTSFVKIPQTETKYENGEITIEFPKNCNVTVWKSGEPISTNSMVIGVANKFSYSPTGPGQYGFIYKIYGNGAEILDSQLIESKKIEVK